MEIALGSGSLVLLAGGLAALMRRTLRPGQAAAVLGVAAMVAVVALLARVLGEGRGLGSFYLPLVVVATTVAGIAMVIAIVIRPAPRIRDR